MKIAKCRYLKVIAGIVERTHQKCSNPVFLNVDRSGDGWCDHSMTGLGYEDRGDDGLWYASYNTWHEEETVDWYEFQDVGNRFGLYSMVYVHPSDIGFDGTTPAPVPEPATMILFGVGLVGLAGGLV